MLTRRTCPWLPALILILVFATRCVTVAPPGPRQAPVSTLPRLVLLIVVDQFRYDYLTRFGDLFGEGGLKRLMRDGAFWVNANYDYVPTKTAPGHAAIMTGAPPARNGIVANEWIDRAAAERITSVGDNSAKLLGGGPNESANSPHLLLANTVGDELRIATNNRAKVIGVSDKPRAAILPAGRRANAAYWLSSDSGNIVSSDYYFPELPRWVVEFNKTRPLDKYFGARWERLLPEREYLKRAGADSPPWENIDDAPGETNAFPHIVTGGERKPGQAFYDALDHSPFVNDVIRSLAEQALVNEHLGQDEVTDLLSVSLSGNDHVGHRFGPASHEAMDLALRVDRQIASLLDFVDARVGLQNTLCVFTSDHGVAPLLDWIVARGLGRGHIQQAEVLTAIRSAISARYRRGSNPTNEGPSDYILKYNNYGVMKDAMLNGNVYFNLAALKGDGVSLNEITELAGDAALKVPGIARYFTRPQLERCLRYGSDSQTKPGSVSTRDNQHAPQCPDDPIARKVFRGFYPDRSGDLIIVQKEFNYLSESADPANHGSPYSYDTHVPVIIMGKGFRAGRYRQQAAPIDIAPTLASVLGIRAPNKSQGRILREAF